jgi:hypothetical protein
MIPRRSILGSGLLGGALGALGGGDDAMAAQNTTSGDLSGPSAARIAEALAGLRSDLQALKAFPEIASVRDAQVTYLRANGKFPDFIEVGTTYWFGVHDWHIRWQQPLMLSRDALGRYTLVFGQTVLVMRVDASPTFMGVPYDNR